MKKIVFGEKGRVVYTPSPVVEVSILEALKVRGWSNVSCEAAPEEDVWEGATRVTAVTGTLGGSGASYLMFLTPDPEADEAVREALSFTKPEASMTSVLMDRPE